MRFYDWVKLVFYRNLIAIFSFLALGAQAFASTDVEDSHEDVLLTSVRPLAFLAKTIIDKPIDVLFPSDISMHDHDFSVKDMERLSQVGTIIWLGPQHEHGLSKLQQRFQHKQWVAVGSEAEHEWLHAEGAFRLLVSMATQLNVKAYGLKVEQFKTELYQARDEWREVFQPLSQTPLLVGHSAIKVFAQDMGLENIKTYAAANSHGHEQSGASELLDIQKLIANGDLYCAIEEPDVSFQKLKKRFSTLQTVKLEPMGTSVKVSEQAYLDYYNLLAEGLYLCLTIK
jgi:ABC-type Zn2+ transport system substrate-binding protein/surface adhesin